MRSSRLRGFPKPVGATGLPTTWCYVTCEFRSRRDVQGMLDTSICIFLFHMTPKIGGVKADFQCTLRLSVDKS